jgi:predicted small metal-binding protein
MARMFVDCREYPSEMNCTVAISADTERELLDAAVQHAVAVHGHQDSPELREQIRKLIKTEQSAEPPPPAVVPSKHELLWSE